MTEFYAYTHARPDAVDANGIFYAGKGRGARDKDFSHRTFYHKNIVAKHGRENVLANRIPCSDEASAIDLEKGLIKCLRRMGVNLANFTDGGEGASGRKHSEETRRKISESNKGKVVSEANRLAAIALFKSIEGVAWTGRKHSEESKRKISAARLGRPNLAKRGVPMSEAAKQKRLATCLAKPIVACPVCGFTSRLSGAMKRYHFGNCKGIPRTSANIEGPHRKPPRAKRTVCPHCGKEGARALMTRWHFDRCRKRGGSGA